MASPLNIPWDHCQRYREAVKSISLGKLLVKSYVPLGVSLVFRATCEWLQPESMEATMISDMNHSKE